MSEECYVVPPLGESPGQHVDNAFDATIVDGRNGDLGVDGECDAHRYSDP